MFDGTNKTLQRPHVVLIMVLIINFYSNSVELFDCSDIGMSYNPLNRKFLKCKSEPLMFSRNIHQVFNPMWF